MNTQFKISVLSLLISICLITESYASNYYWVAGTGNWSDFATHWATSSGGTSFHIATPSPSDDVFFDANSFLLPTDTVKLDIPNAFCNNFSWQNVLSGSNFTSVTITNKVSILGSVNIDASSKISFKATLSLESPNTGNTVSILDSLISTIEFNSPTGGWGLSNALKLKGDIHLVAGALNTNNFPITCSSLISNYGTPNRTLISGSSDFIIKDYDGYYFSSPTDHYFDIDTILVFDGTNNTLYFEGKLDADTLQSGGHASFHLNSGNQNYKAIHCDAFGFVNTSMGGFIGVGNFTGHFERTIIPQMTFNNFTLNWIGSHFYFNSDSLIGTGVFNPEISMVSDDSIEVNYLESPWIDIQVGIYSRYNKIIATTGPLNVFTYLLPSSSTSYFGDVFTGGIFTDDNSLQGTNSHMYGKCVIMGNGNFHGSNCFFDTLMFNQGHTYTIDVGDTVTTNNQFIAFGTPAAPIQIHSATTGTQAKMIFNQNNVCSDYLYLRDMNAIGTNIVAGANSQNIANNTGWQFVACSVVSNVWPGDANYDLIVNNFDLLNIGLAYGETGPLRTGGSNNYIAQPATDWSSFFNTAVNKKPADCDGNGTVNANDTLAVSLNYSMTHPARLSSPLNGNSTGVPLYFDMPTGSIAPGSIVDIPIYIGTASSPADSIYGIALTINYDPSFIQTGTMSIDFINSWMVTPVNNIHIEKNFSPAGNLDFALSRIDHSNISGYGLIATLHFTVSSTASGLLTLSFSNPLAVTSYQSIVPLNLISGSVLTGIEEISNDYFLTMYPNPFTKSTSIRWNIPKDFDNAAILFYNNAGILIDKYKIQQKGKGELQVLGSKLPAGIYSYSLIVDSKLIDSKKIVKSK